MPIAVHLGEGVKLSAARVESRPTLGTGVGGDRVGAAEGGDGGVDTPPRNYRARHPAPSSPRRQPHDMNHQRLCLACRANRGCGEISGLVVA
jgi:hypothetical protein